MASYLAKIFRNLKIMGSRESSIDIVQENNLEEGLEIHQGNNFEEVLEHGPNCCIYKVPQFLRSINEGAYTPRLISIGPLHYDRQELMGMQSLKRRYCSTFWEEVNNAQKLDDFKTYLKDNEEGIRAHYSVISKLQSPEYIEMILCDAVFVVKFILGQDNDTNKLLINPLLIIYLTVDLLLLENQLPYSVLDHLYTLAFPSSEENPSFSSYSFNFISTIGIFNGMLSSEAQTAQPEVKHLTDFLRRSLIMKVQPPFEADSYGHYQTYDLPSATKLNESGLKFRLLKEKCFLDISFVKRKRGKKWLPWFEVNEVHIPCINIFDETECLFRSLMALEIFLYPSQNHICNYAIMMDFLINTAKDVDLLVDKEIIVSCLGDNEAVAKMFNSLCSHIPVGGESCYYDIVKKIKEHYKYPWNHLKATLKSVYFSNLWTGTATVAAAFLLVLTAIQTVCSIIQLLGNSKDNGTSS